MAGPCAVCGHTAAQHAGACSVFDVLAGGRCLCAGYVDPAWFTAEQLRALQETARVDYQVATEAGGVQWEWHRDGWDVEIEFDASGRIVSASAEQVGASTLIDRLRALEQEMRAKVQLAAYRDARWPNARSTPEGYQFALKRLAALLASSLEKSAVTNDAGERQRALEQSAGAFLRAAEEYRIHSETHRPEDTPIVLAMLKARDALRALLSAPEEK